MSSVAHEARLPVARSPLPSWRAAFVSAFLGWVIALWAFALLGLAASELGLMGRPNGSGLADWPYPDAGWASWTANLVVWFLIFGLTALLIRGFLSDRSQSPVSAITVFGILVLTGFAPLVPRGLLDLPEPLAFLATAGLLRLAHAAELPVFSKQVTTAALLVGALLLAIPAVHALRHPLWLGGAVFGLSPGSSSTTISVENAGFAEMRLESVSLRTLGSVRYPVDVRVEDDWPPSRGGPFASPGLPSKLEGRSETFMRIELTELVCGTGPMDAEAVVSYRVFGNRRVTVLPVTISPKRCS
jgi:hypothetical protein